MRYQDASKLSAGSPAGQSKRREGASSLTSIMKANKKKRSEEPLRHRWGTATGGNEQGMRPQATGKKGGRVFQGERDLDKAGWAKGRSVKWNWAYLPAGVCRRRGYMTKMGDRNEKDLNSSRRR